MWQLNAQNTVKADRAAGASEAVLLSVWPLHVDLLLAIVLRAFFSSQEAWVAECTEAQAAQITQRVLGHPINKIEFVRQRGGRSAAV